MAVPKKRKTHSATAQARIHKKLSGQSVAKCKNCGNGTMAHYACPNCGYYKGRKVTS